MFYKFLHLMHRNPWFPLLAVLCVLDAMFVISGLAGNTPWSKFLVAEIPKVIPKKFELTPLGIAHVVGWTIFPPGWFFIETFTIDDKLLPSAEHATDASLKAEYDRLRVAQELASKVWAAILAAILFFAPK